MGSAEDAARQHEDEVARLKEEQAIKRLKDWMTRILEAHPIALLNLEQHDHPLQVPGSGMGRWIAWEGEDRYAWPLMRHQEQTDEVYILADGTFLISPYGAEDFRQADFDEVASESVAQALERMKEFGGGVRRYRTRKLSWAQVFGLRP